PPSPPISRSTACRPTTTSRESTAGAAMAGSVASTNAAIGTRRWRCMPAPQGWGRIRMTGSGLYRQMVSDDWTSAEQSGTVAARSRDKAWRRPPMILVTGHVRVRPEDLDRLRPHIRAVLTETRKEKGCLVYAFGEDFLDPGLIRIVERWEDWPSLEAHGKTPHIDAWRAALKQATVLDREVIAHT